MTSSTCIERAESPLPFEGAVDPLLEAGAYEELWLSGGMTEKKIADLFRRGPVLPSELVGLAPARRNAAEIVRRLQATNFRNWGIRLNGAGNYPVGLRDADHPIELLYYAGDWGIVSAPSVSVVGTRKPTAEGRVRAKKLVRHLVSRGFCIVSGLAAGIDTAAHNAAFEFGGLTVGVIGTPLNSFYPKENTELQARIAQEFCLISQVPFLRYEAEPFQAHRNWFPKRNVTMASLTQATIIVEAGETSGTLTQARAALKQGKKVLILESNFNKGLSWPAAYERKGAIRIRDERDLDEHLP